MQSNINKQASIGKLKDKLINEKSSGLFSLSPYVQL